MKLSSALLHRLSWLNLPGALLIALLQRTPVLRVLAGAGSPVAQSPVGQWLRSVFTLAGVGALHARAGATTFVQSPASNPITGAVGIPLSAAFTYTGTPSPPQYFLVTGALPPGLVFIPAAVNGVVRSGAPAIAGTPSQGGNFTVRVQGFGLAGNGNPEPINFSINGGLSVPPTFSLQPVSQTATPGSNVTFTAAASGTPTPTFQWRRNNAVITGATGASLTLTNVQASDAADYSVVIANSAGNLASDVARLTVGTLNATARLTNLSVRTAMAAGQTLIMGFTVQGGPKSVLLRAVGPGLAQFNVSGTMVDPRLALFKDSTQLVTNNNWGGDAALSAAFASVGAFALPPASLDAALVRSIEGGHTAQVTGTGAGTVLVEAYDAGTGLTPRLTNVSARNRAGTGGDILIASFTVDGTGERTLLIRAIGPTLASFGVTGLLADPKLEIYSGATKIAENDTWSAGLAGIFSSVGAFALTSASKDAALTISLPQGGYTVQVSGADGGTGEALIEIYELP